MAKRFIDTGYFKSPFVRSLEAPMKLLYSFIICECSPAGIWIVDFEIASLYLGQPVSQKLAVEVFVGNGKATDIGDGRWFIPGFIRHQYPKGLQETNPAHSKIITELKKYGLIDSELSLIQAPLMTLQRPLNGSKDKVMVKDKVIQELGGMEERGMNVEFEEARKMYPATKRSYEVEFKNFIKKYPKDWKVIVVLLKPAIEGQIRWRKREADAGHQPRFWKDFQTWINQSAWTEEIPKSFSLSYDGKPQN